MENRLTDDRRAAAGLVDLLLDTEDEDRGRKLALLLAVVLHLLLITVTLPTMMREAPQPASPALLVRITRWVPQPPPLQAPIPAASRAPLEARRIPVPDPRAEHPEPAMEPPAELPSRAVMPSVEIELGTPEPPPATGSFRPGIDGVSFPVLLKNTQILPDYPRLARKAGVTGRVMLEAVVRADGSVGDVEVLQTPGAHLGFEEAATEAVRQWRYRPGMQSGRPVAVHFTILLDFRLE